MSFDASADFSAGVSKAGLTDLSVQPLAAGDVATGPVITTGIVYRTRGMFGWYGTAPDDAVRLKLLSASAGVLDVAVLLRATAAGGVAAIQQEISEPVWEIGG